ncbi:MAG: hydrogenase [Lentisphaeria bacterium]|nr:hydrogenase [Lentisphaeria bacterium]
MNMAIDLVLTAFLGICLMLSASSRLVHCIRLVALQGILLGVLPLLMWNWSKACPGAEIWGAAFVNIMVKGVLLPILLIRAMRKAGVKRELEPLAGYSWSLLIVSVASALALWLSRSLTIPGVSVLAIPAAAVTVFTGLFIIVSRRKAITQSLGFLAFENGIALFGAAMHLEYGFFVELGILLDVLVLVFVMGIAVFQISREFEHIDADRLNLLTDTGEVK